MENPNNPHGNNPLHGVKLVDILEYLIENVGWEAMGDNVKINCFHSNQTLKSSLKFLRTTPWAREKVEEYYLKCIKSIPLKKD
jgi:uncharacterized protein (DUF2132 family)